MRFLHQWLWSMRRREFERRDARRQQQEILYRGELERDGYMFWARQFVRRLRDGNLSVELETQT
jgi:hypothetical protein